MQYELFYTEHGVIRTLLFRTLEDALPVFNSVAKLYGPAWIYGPDGKAAFGNVPEGFTRLVTAAPKPHG